MLRPVWHGVLDILVLSCLLCTPQAQVIDLSSLPVPSSFTLSVHRVLFAETTGDSDTRIEFQDVMVHSLPASDGNQTLMSKLASNDAFVHVGLVPFTNLWKFLDPNNFCGQSGLALLAPAKGVVNPGGVKPYLLGATGTKQSKGETLPGTGTYAVIIANCGDSSSIGMSGSVAIKSPWGYLPCTHKGKLFFYKMLVAVTACIALAWLALSVRWWRQLLAFQKGITLVAVLAVAEAGLWCGFLSSWNDTGTTDESLFWLAQMTSESKVVVAMASVLCLTLLAEDVRPQTPCCDEADIVMPMQEHLFIVVFMVIELNRVINAHFRYSQVFKLTFVIVNAVPAIVFGVVLWFRIFSRVGSTLESIVRREGEEHKQVVIVSRIRGLMVLVAICGTATATLQIFDPTMSTADSSLWKYHYIVSDGMGQVCSVLFLLAAMVIGKPNEYLQPVGYAVTAQQGDEHTIGAPATIWDDDDQLDDFAEPEKAETGAVE